MSAPEKVDTRARLLVYARWAAIGLACLAALIIAASSGGAALRIAAFLAVIAVVLVVLSITLNGAASTKLHLEETLLDEIDMLRDDVRADITTAARATHRALAEKVAHLHENIEHVRRQVDDRAIGDGRPAVGLPVGAPPARRAIAGPPAAAVVHTETVQVTTHQTYVDPVDDGRAAPFARPTTRRPDYAEPGRADHGRPEFGADRNAHRDVHGGDAARQGGHDHGGWADRRDFDAPPAPRPPAREEPWSDPRTPGFAAPRVPDRYDESGQQPSWRADAPGRPGGHGADLGRGRNDDVSGDDGQWPSVRSGDRWAELRADERGRELRIGERRTSVHSDETGTQMRIVDRWSSVREDVHYTAPNAAEPGVSFRPGADGRGAEHDAEPGRGAEHGRDDARGAEATGETRRERRQREEAEEASSRYDDDRRPGRRSAPEPEADRWGTPERSHLALPASGPESAAGWMRGQGEEDRWAAHGHREISGEVVRHSAPEPMPRRSDHTQPEPARPVIDGRPGEPRGLDWHADPRAPMREHGGREGYAREAGPARENGFAGPSREPGLPPGGRGAAPEQSFGRDAGPGVEHGGFGPGRDGGFGAPGREPGYGPPPPARDPHGRDGQRRDSHALDGQRRDLSGRDAQGRDPRDRDGYGRGMPPRDPHEPGPAGRDPSGDGGFRDGGSAVPDPRDGGRRAARDDNQWEREPSGGRSTLRPPAFDFDGNDDRWR